MISHAQRLSTQDLAALEHESWIDPSTAEQFGLYRVTSIEGAALVGRDNREDYAGIAFPVYWPGGDHAREYFLRRDHPPVELRDGKQKPKGKYLAPPGRSNSLLFGPGESPDVLTDATRPMLLVEGLKKLCAAWRLSRYNTEQARVLPCALSGAWNWKGTIGKTADEHGARVDVKGVISDFDRVVWRDREVIVGFDSDCASNPSVAAARQGLHKELLSRGARVRVCDLPALDDLEKTGFDDLLARWGPQAVLDWLQQAQANAAAVLDDPEPIPLDALSVPALPTSLIPSPWLRDMIEATGAATETPVELPLMLATGVIAICIQRKYVIEPEPGYSEPTNIWNIAGLDPGNRKTAVLQHMTAPLLNFEQEHADTNARSVAEAGALRRLAEDRIKHLRQKAARADGADLTKLRQELLDEEANLPEVPNPLRLWCQDVTPEKLGQLMADNEETMAILSDEGGIFDILAGRYSNNVPNLDLILQAHSGAPHRVDRGSRPAVYLQRPALTLVLSPQPSVLRGLAAVQGFRGRGLLARPLYVLPPSRLGFRTLESCPIPEPVRAAYRAGIYQLLLLPPRADGRPHVTRFSKSAYRQWKDFQLHVEVELRDGGRFEHIRDWASKLPGNVARVAAVLHCAVHASERPEDHDVDIPTTEAALTLGGIFEQHALAVFSLMAVDSNIDAARKVWAWVARGCRKTFTKRDCFKGVQSSAFPDMDTVQAALQVLVERGYIFPLPSEPRPGRPSPGYHVNRRFAEEWRP